MGKVMKFKMKISFGQKTCSVRNYGIKLQYEKWFSLIIFISNEQSNPTIDDLLRLKKKIIKFRSFHIFQ